MVLKGLITMISASSLTVRGSAPTSVALDETTIDSFSNNVICPVMIVPDMGRVGHERCEPILLRVLHQRYTSSNGSTSEQSREVNNNDSRLEWF